MKLFNLKPQRHRKPPFKPDDRNQAPMDIPNLLKETIIDAPNVAYASDFTYLPYFENSFILLRLKMFLPEKSSAGKYQPDTTQI